MKIQQLILVFLSSYFIAEADAQNSFSPFSFINSFLKSVPGWPLHHNSPVKQQRSTVQQLNQKTQKTSFFRPHLALGPSITHSQSLPAVVRLPPTNSQVWQGPAAPSLQSSLEQNLQIVGPPVSKPPPPPPPPSPHTANIFIGSPSLEPEESAVSVINNDGARLNGESRNTKSQFGEILSEASVGPAPASQNNYNLHSKDSSSGPNPGGDNFPIISLIDDHPSVNYYDSVLQNFGPSTPNDLVRTTRNENVGFNSVSNAENTFSLGSSFLQVGPTNPTNYNPYYAPEEFTYNQDPILIDNNIEDQQGFEEIVENSITEENQVTEDDLTEITEDDEDILKATTTTSYIEYFEEATEKTQKSPRSLNAKDVFRKRVKSKEFSNLVKTIEYKPSDLKIRIKKKEQDYSSNYNFIPTLVKCKEFEEVGYCGYSESYPLERISWLLQNCSSLLSSFQAVVPDELDRLGDNSESVITSEKDEDRPWSWRVYAYKKRQACDSQVSLIRPTYAVDSTGEPQLIIQTDSIVQRVPVDVCSSPGSPCGGLEQCSLRSLCVQRYTYHYLLSSKPGQHQHCPAIRAFKLPTACVCHAQVDSSRFGDKLV